MYGKEGGKKEETMKRTKKLHILIDEEVCEQLKVLKEKEERSFSYLINQSLHNFVNMKQKRGRGKKRI